MAYLPPGIVEAGEPLGMSPVRQRSIPVLPLPQMTACGGESRASLSSEMLLSSTETRKADAKMSVYLDPLKEFVCLGQAVPNQQTVGIWAVFGAASLMLYLQYLLTGPCQRCNIGSHGGGLGSGLLQLLLGATVLTQMSLLKAWVVSRRSWQLLSSVVSLF